VERATGFRRVLDAHVQHSGQDSTGSTELHVAQVLLTSHNKQEGQIVLRCLYCPALSVLRVARLSVIFCFTKPEQAFISFECWATVLDSRRNQVYPVPDITCRERLTVYPSIVGVFSTGIVPSTTINRNGGPQKSDSFGGVDEGLTGVEEFRSNLKPAFNRPIWDSYDLFGTRWGIVESSSSPVAGLPSRHPLHFEISFVSLY